MHLLQAWAPLSATMRHCTGKLLVCWTQWKTIQLKLCGTAVSLQRCPGFANSLGQVAKTCSIRGHILGQSVQNGITRMPHLWPSKLCRFVSCDLPCSPSRSQSFLHYLKRSETIQLDSLLETSWGWLSRIAAATAVHCACEDAEVGSGSAGQGSSTHELAVVSGPNVAVLCSTSYQK